jgi:hypothetical protein
MSILIQFARRNAFALILFAFAIVLAILGHDHFALPLLAVAAAPAKGAPLAPFRYNTGRKIVPLNRSKNFVNNAQLDDTELTNIGFVARIWMRFTATVNCGGGGSAFKDEGPWSILKRIILESNEGGVFHWDTSGYGAKVVADMSLGRGFRLDAGGIGDAAPHPDVYRAGLAAGDNAWTLWFPILVNLSQYMNREVGLIAAQAREIILKVKIQTEDIANVITNVGTGVANGKIDFFRELYNVPPDGVQLPSWDVLHTLETSKDFSATGDVNFDVPPLGTLLQIFHIVKINGLRSDAIDRWELQFNENNKPYQVDRGLMRLRAQVRTGVGLPVGVYYMDFADGMAELLDGDMPDVIDTRNPALMQSRIVVTDGTALGATNTIRTIRRVLAAVRQAQ